MHPVMKMRKPRVPENDVRAIRNALHVSSVILSSSGSSSMELFFTTFSDDFLPNVDMLPGDDYSTLFHNHCQYISRCLSLSSSVVTSLQSLAASMFIKSCAVLCNVKCKYCVVAGCGVMGGNLVSGH